MTSAPSTPARVAALAGLVMPLLFGSTATVLSILQYDFMRGLGWHPLTAPTMDWPSGLALGAYGDAMVAAFAVCGGLVTAFAVQLGRQLACDGVPNRGGLWLALAGAAFSLLAFRTDPTVTSLPATWHGRVHDAAYVLLGLSLSLAWIALARAFGRLPAWRTLGRLTWINLLLAIPSFAIKGLAFYAFMACVGLWFAGTGWVLWRQMHRLTRA